MEFCPQCNKGKLKHTRSEYTVKTRLENRNELRFENLPVKECTICTFSEIEPKGEEMIQAVKIAVKNEMRRAAKEDQKEIQEKKKNLFSAFRNIRK